MMGEITPSFQRTQHIYTPTLEGAIAQLAFQPPCLSVYTPKKPCILITLCRHKAILDYLSASGFHDSFTALKAESLNDDFVPDPKQKYAGLLEKKWTSVIRLQKKVRPVMIPNPLFPQRD